MKRSMGVLAAVLILSACSGEHDIYGEVVQKNYEGSTRSVAPVTTCGANGCSTGLVTTGRGECYRLVVKHDDGEIDTGCMDPKFWVTVEVGDIIPPATDSDE